MVHVQQILNDLDRRIDILNPVSHEGRVVQVRGLVIEADGPNVALGDICKLDTNSAGGPCHAEVVGFSNHRILLMPLEDIHGIHPGCKVTPALHSMHIPCGMSLMGRVMDGLGRPLDKGPSFQYSNDFHLHSPPPDALTRQRISEPFTTGVRAIDLFTPMGKGQRMGLFAGSGVGKTTLMGMIARNGEADVNVIALVGERGRELRELLEKDFGPDGLKRSVIVVATSDRPALVRLRAAYLATAIAEWFREQGLNVLFMMDSVTRFAMAQREIGLSVGEPPASRGYPPSTFALLPKLMERTGCSSKGSITAFYTVLVEGDDMNEPIADSVRGILDGHLVLSRTLANANQYPAIDVLDSISRLTRDICSDSEINVLSTARDRLALYRKHEDLINIGAYTEKSNPLIDKAISAHHLVSQLLRQNTREHSSRTEAFNLLNGIFS